MTRKGVVQAIIVIQYEAFIDGQWRAIIRFDGAHGFFHRDILLPSGKQQKIAHSARDKGVALTAAIADIKHNWKAYRTAYEEKYYEK